MKKFTVAVDQVVIRYDTTEEFNVDWKAEWGQLNLAHVARNNKKAQLSLTNRATRKPAKIAPIRRAYNVVADNTGLSSCV